MNAVWAGLFAAALGVAGLGLAYGAAHLGDKTNRVRLWALVGLAATAAGVWETWLVVSGAYRAAPHLLGLFNGALLALGPCLWLQARAAAGFVTGRWTMAAQFAPFALHMALLACLFWPLSAEQKQAIAELSLSPAHGVDWIGSAKLIHLAVYAALIVFTVRQGLARIRARLSRYDASELYWIAGFAAALGVTAVTLLALSVPTHALDAHTLNNTGSLVLAGLAVAIAARSLQADARQPVSPVPRYARSGLDDDRLAAFAKRIETAMDREALHTDPELTLDRLATVVRLTPQQVSQALNQQLGVSFYAFVNARRVEAAKTLLRHSDISVLDAAMQAGFATKATFNKAFKAATGCTPSAYRASQR